MPVPISYLSHQGTKGGSADKLFRLSSILGIAAGRCLANGSTAEANPDPFWNFPVIVLLGESENRLACILGSIPIFWPVVESAAERIQGLYRILITQEFVVDSTRALPGEFATNDGAYEAPQWAEHPNEVDRSTHESDGHEEKEAFANASEMPLPRWPESRVRSAESSSMSDENV